MGVGMGTWTMNVDWKRRAEEEVPLMMSADPSTCSHTSARVAQLEPSPPHTWHSSRGPWVQHSPF